MVCLKCQTRTNFNVSEIFILTKNFDNHSIFHLTDTQKATLVEKTTGMVQSYIVYIRHRFWCLCWSRPHPTLPLQICRWGVQLLLDTRSFKWWNVCEFSYGKIWIWYWMLWSNHFVSCRNYIWSFCISTWWTLSTSQSSSSTWWQWQLCQGKSVRVWLYYKLIFKIDFPFSNKF